MTTENKLKIGIVASKFNEEITNALIKGAEYFWHEGYIEEAEYINRHGLQYKHGDSPILQQYSEAEVAIQLYAKMPPQITLLRVPGAYELPQGVQWLAQTEGRNSGEDTQLDGIVALGAIIRGDTPHFDYIASAATQGIMDVGLKHNIPVGFGMITANSYEEAKLRSDIEIIKSYADSLQAQNNKVDKNKTAASNKGYEAAKAVWEMIVARKKITN